MPSPLLIDLHLLNPGQVPGSDDETRRALRLARLDDNLASLTAAAAAAADR